MVHIQTLITEEFETLTEEGELTVINIIATPSRRYESGWWVQLMPDIFIRPCGTSERLGLVFAFNIPIAPVKHYFINGNDTLRFTLFFPALPYGTTHIDIIEKAGRIRDHFNFFNVPVTKIRSEILRH